MVLVSSVTTFNLPFSSDCHWRNSRPNLTSFGSVSPVAKLKRDINPIYAEDGLSEIGDGYSRRQYLELLRDWIDSKGFYYPALTRLEDSDDTLGRILGVLFFREEGYDTVTSLLIGQMVKEALKLPPLTVEPTYFGTPEQNWAIDSAISESDDLTSECRRSAKRGVSSVFPSSSVIGNTFYGESQSVVNNTPVIILGAGPTGKAMVRLSVQVGVPPSNITVIDESGVYDGLWNDPDNAKLSRNNPIPITFLNQTLPEATYESHSASEIVDFLKRLETGYDKSLPEVTKAKVLKVIPGDLYHKVYIEGRDAPLVAPIVVNAIGNGPPTDPNVHPLVTTDTPEAAGHRGQMYLDRDFVQRNRGGHVVINGMGNSAFEVSGQLEKINSILGLGSRDPIGYSIFSTYPEESVQNPNTSVRHNGRTFRMFRDLNQPVFTRVAGELKHVSDPYFSALRENRIHSGLRHWSHRNGQFSFINESGESGSVPCSELFSLLGFKHRRETLDALGLNTTTTLAGEEVVSVDYDGEVRYTNAFTGRSALHPGYFAAGGLLKSRLNPNAQTIPGQNFRNFDTACTMLIRMAEYQHRMGRY